MSDKQNMTVKFEEKASTSTSFLSASLSSDTLPTPSDIKHSLQKLDILNNIAWLKI